MRRLISETSDRCAETQVRARGSCRLGTCPHRGLQRFSGQHVSRSDFLDIHIRDFHPGGSTEIWPTACAGWRPIAFLVTAWRRRSRLSVFNQYRPDYRAYLLGYRCLLYTSDAADEEDSVDLGGR